jgi:ParB-like chromosome segregation protein Spo0J
MTMTSETGKRAIVLWPVADLIPYPKNAKKHSPEQISRLARSIARLGVSPVQVEPGKEGCVRGQIIAGHGRRLAVLELGRALIPVDVRDDLTKIECDALRIADNAAVSNDVDYELMSAETVRLSEEGFELQDLGLTDAEIRALNTDIGVLDDSAFVSDIGGAVEIQKEINVAAETAIDTREGPVGEALGFKRVTTEQGRIIRGFIARIEVETGLKGAAALVKHIVE